MNIPINKVSSGQYGLSKSSHPQSLRNPKTSIHPQQSSEIATLRKESINSLAWSLLQKEQHSSKLPANQGFQSKDPRITNIISTAQLMTLAKHNSNRNSQMHKLEELKKRFKKIKNSYEQNHKQINSNITNCIENYKDRCSSKQHHSHVHQFEILNEDLTFSQSRQFNPNDSINFQNHNQQISFRNEINPMEHITVNPYENKQNHISSANQSLSQSYHENKYKSLSKQLQTMRHGELVDLLIEQIQDNEKNKHLIFQQTQIINSLKNSTQQKYSQIPKLKQEISNKQEEVESKREQIQILLETERKNLQIIQKLKKQVQEMSRNEQKSLFLQHSQIHKSRAVQKEICIITSPDSSKIFAEKQDMNESVDYKQKHDELKKYMNEYINNVNQAFEEYKRNLQQLKQSNHSLKQNNINLSQQMQQNYNSKRQLQNELMKASKQFQKLSHALGNSKEVIRELEEEFLILKDQNAQMKMILQKGGCELIEMKNLKQMMINEMDNLVMDNENLHQKNQILNQELAQIQERIFTNSEIETEVRTMITGLSQEKNNLQEELHKHIQQNEKLQKQLKSNQQTISALRQSQKTLEQRVKDLETRIKTLDQTISELTLRQQMIQKQNNILQETNREMQKLQEQLLFEYECEKDEKSKLRSQLVTIMNQVKQMENIYVNELSSNQLIKNQLSQFWKNQSHSNTYKNINLTHKNHKQPNPKQEKTHVTINPQTQSHQKSQNSAENMSNSELSFKKNSQMTKQGSGSSVFRHNNNSDEMCIYSKVEQHQNNSINASSIVDGSRITQKYYSETDSDVHQELQILKSSKNTNPNVYVENTQGKIRMNGKVGSIKNKENR